MQVFSIVGGSSGGRALAVLLVLLSGVLSTEFAGAAERPGPRVLLIHDMEGLSGQSDPYTFLYGHPAYPRGQALLIADVNAVIAGLFAGGASSVVVADGHGSGNPGPDILVDKLDKRARLISRSEPFDAYLDLAQKSEFDAVAVVGMHCKSGSGGFAAHTYTIGMELLVNGHSITETELVGLLYGRAGIPVIFASGDDRLAADLKTMPWLQYVTTKKAKSASDAELYPVEQVHEAMRKQAKLAVQRLSSAVVMRPEGPLQIAVRAVAPANMRWLKAMPGVNYENETVSFTASDMADGYRRMRPIVTALSFSFADAELAPYNAQPNVDDLKFKGMEELYRRWFAAESGHAVAAPAPSARKLEYHGFE